MKKFLILLPLTLSFILSGCTNPYKEYYNSTFESSYFTPEEREDIIFLKDGEEPILIKTPDMDEAVYDALAKGYIILGFSSFTGPLNDISLLVRQAKDVKATHVLYDFTFSETRSGTTSIALPDYQTTNSQGSIISPYGGYANYYGTSTTVGTKYIPMTYHVDRYNQVAAFFVQNKKRYRFGIRTDDLTQEQRSYIGQNTGAVITLVMYDSPAFNANIMRNDILIKIDNTKIINSKQAAETMSSVPFGTKKVIFTVFRNNQKINIPVMLDDKNNVVKNNFEQETKQQNKTENAENPILQIFNSIVNNK